MVNNQPGNQNGGNMAEGWVNNSPFQDPYSYNRAWPWATTIMTDTKTCMSPRTVVIVYITTMATGHLRDVTAKAGVGGAGWSSSATWVDLDNDGWLDLVVVRYVDWDFDDHICLQNLVRRSGSTSRPVPTKKSGVCEWAS